MDNDSSNVDKNNDNNNHHNNTVHLSCTHQRLERSHDTYQPKYDILYTHRAQSHQNYPDKAPYGSLYTYSKAFRWGGTALHTCRFFSVVTAKRISAIRGSMCTSCIQDQVGCTLYFPDLKLRPFLTLGKVRI